MSGSPPSGVGGASGSPAKPPPGTAFVSPGDADYPALLAVTPSPPPIFVRGSVLAEDGLAVAIVGARRASAYGIEVAERLASELAARGVTIVSGLARGIDTAAHRGALAGGGRTVAVLGHGIDLCYPPENRPLADEIAARGALVSQFFPGTRPQAWHFPARNRTLAGLALGVVVVEAAERSGALITAGAAADFGREVYAVPGRITSETACGPHGLLRDGATLVRSWMDIVQELPSPWRNAVRDTTLDLTAHGGQMTGVSTGRAMLSADEATVLAALTVDDVQHIEEVIGRCGMGPARVGAALVSLELTGRARQLEGQRWVAVGARAGRP